MTITTPNAVMHTGDFTNSQVCGIDSSYMKLEKGRDTEAHPIRAALYARVSTIRQRDEATIESQLAELKQQIAAANRVLVKEYIDDGYSGKYLDRPALDELRRDTKGDVFDAIYFLCADRIARRKIHQDIIISELWRRKKRIVISGKDYEDNPENKFTIDVLGIVAEFERAKIAERTMRGKLHRLRQGHVAGGGIAPYGYHYVSRTGESPAALIAFEPEAAIVRWMFETIAAGGALRQIARSLEERNVLTKLGKTLWRSETIREILKNHIYVGVRYYNKTTEEKEPDQKRGKRVDRDRSEWIGVKVPALVSTELFDAVQERLGRNTERYCQPATHYLLSGLVECGECGAGVASYRRYFKKELVSGTQRVFHKSAYKCIWRFRQKEHAPGRVERCYNPEIVTHMLDGLVLDVIREIVLDSDKLLACIEKPKRAVHGMRGVSLRLSGIATHMTAIEDERRRLVELYYSDRLSSTQYIEANRALDEKLVRLKRDRAELAEGIRPVSRDAMVEASVRQFSENARASFASCSDLETNQQFLAQHIERVIYWQDRIAIVGSVPSKTAGAESESVPFRIDRKIDRKVLKAKPRAPLPGDGRFRQWNPKFAAVAPAPFDGSNVRS